ncbi:BCCT family transporter [Nocardia sp. NPDC059764]|uniref:BCCT family transporter n=1 Tax=Nocardia sp. NPDC059764 TaxID=3346939 RepID=UPI00365B0ECA
MSTTRHTSTETVPAHHRVAVAPRVFWPSAIVVTAFTVYAIVFRDTAARQAKTLQDTVIGGFGWYYILIVSLGVGSTPAQRADSAMVQTFLHWGIHPWAIYVVVGLAIAYSIHRKGRPVSIRWSLAGDKVRGWRGDLIDVVAVIGTVFGVATSLGLGLAILVIVLFFVTSADSGALVVNMLSSGGNPEPPTWSRAFWTTAQGAVAAALLVASGTGTAALTTCRPWRS